jgi:Fe-S cluster assembly iron-binding protein IscA
MFAERAKGDDVFELTSRAAAALAETRAQSGLADTIAIRISASESGNGSSAGYQVRFASHPAPNDVVVESSGTKVFLAEELVEPLETSVLDTVDTAQGEKLVLKHRTEG